jgi:hypothetical protein
MTNLETQLYQNIIVLIQRGNVYLHNKLGETIEELIYETTSMFTTDDVIAVSSTPSYKIVNIRSNTAVFLEILDGWDDGKVSYYLTKVKTKTIDFQDQMGLKTKQLSGMVKLPQIIDCEVVKLNSKEGFIVDFNKKAINELYWLAEELQAYTHLTGSRFDLDNAQNRLWRMQPILKANDFPEIQRLFDVINEQLEMVMAFDKLAFTENVENLYGILEKINGKK